uniref:Protein amnionless n=1 Tax=Neogobius melanostomus TaxID=47308 RepID=A0A8C6T8M2_9GOBI
MGLVKLQLQADALYKQWIPDTNFENQTNWNTGVIPCGDAVAHFPAQRKVSVFVETAHAVKELRLPIVGEFIFNSGAGFFVPNGHEPGCESTTIKFKNTDLTKWFDPALWQSAATQDDLENKNFVFSVHEESVPCYYDHVVFKDGSSFRVDTSSNQAEIPVQCVSVFGNTFKDAGEFSRYLQTQTGQLQFHGSSSVIVGASVCGDPTGCACDNTGNRQRICDTVTCPSASCKKPLLPMGHCCDVCGAIVTIQYTSNFQLETYRQRIQHLFLGFSQYKSVQVGMSKVFRPVRLMNIIPFGAKAEIQVVVVDEASGFEAESLAREIVKDANSQGSNLGILEAGLQASSGTNDGQSGNAGMIAGIVLGIVIMLALVAILVVLVNKRVVRMPSLPPMPTMSWLQRRSGSHEELGGPLDLGYDNPMFDKPTVCPDIPSLYAPEINMSITMGRSQVHFVNPVYDEKETDFNA